MHEYKYYIKKITKNGDDAVILELGDIRGIPVFDFEPGQYVMIYYKDKKGDLTQKHTFSIASSPTENGSVRLGIRVLGSFTSGILQLEMGDEIFVSEPYGNFTFKKEKHFDLVLIAGGVGITPFMSALRYATLQHLPNKLTLLYSNRTRRSALFLDEIYELTKKNENIRALFSITEERLSQNVKGMLNQKIDSGVMKNFIGHTYGKTFFICGPPSFMTAMIENLKSIGVDDSQIETEAFSMMPDSGWWLKIRNTVYALGFAGIVFLLPFYFIQRAGKSATVANSNAPAVDLNSATATPSGVSPVTVSAPSTVSAPIGVPLPARRTRTS